MSLQLPWNNRMDCNLPEKLLEVPQTTLQTKIKMLRPQPINKATIPILGTKPGMFSEQEEAELVGYVIELQKIFMRLTINDLENMAIQVAEKYRKIKFKNSRAVFDRLGIYGFMKRHPEIILRLPDQNCTTYTGFNMAELEYFYKSLCQVYDFKKIPPDRIYNTRVIGILTREKESNIVNKTGNKFVGFGCNGITINAKVCSNAVGYHMPVMMIFPHNLGQSDLMYNARPGSWAAFTDIGTLTSEIFIQWFQRFINFSDASIERQVVLLFDGQPIYTRNIEIIKMARDNGVNIISFPPYTQHRLQPFDEQFINDLNEEYDQVLNDFLQCNTDNLIMIRYIAGLFEKSFVQAATSSAVVDGYKRCGIYPLDSNIFTESDFIPAKINAVQIKPHIAPQSTNRIEDPFYKRNEYNFDLYHNPRPGCSFWPD